MGVDFKKFIVIIFDLVEFTFVFRFLASSLNIPVTYLEDRQVIHVFSPLGEFFINIVYRNSEVKVVPIRFLEEFLMETFETLWKS